jgi:flagellar assembly protein FliH
MTSSFERRGGPRPPGSATRDPGLRTRLQDEAEALRGGAPGGASTNAYARFIPREEVRSFSAWTPSSFGDTPASSPAEAAAPAEAPRPAASPEVQAQLQAARQAGYQDGYRDGLVALDGFKQSYAQQVTGQMAAVTQAYRQQLEQIEQALAGQVAEVAILLARQVVRSELSLHPEQVVQLVQEALGSVLASARQIAVHLNPDDHALVQMHAGEALAARGARLVADPALRRGGCVIDTELGVIDASLEARWQRAVEGMGRTIPLEAAPEPAPGEQP